MTDNMQVKNQVLNLSDGTFITYRHIEGSYPAIFYLHGTQSSIDSTKALFMENFCKENNIAFTSLNFRGHGDSWGEYTDGTISMWLADALAVMDNVIKGEQIVVGSSMGGWIMLLLAMRRPERVKGMIGLAAAPDFTAAIMEALPDEMKKELAEKGLIYLPDGYTAKGEPFTYNLIQDGNNNLVLNHDITSNAKTILIQGDKDICVSPDTPDKIKEKLSSDDVEIIHVEDGKHNLSTPEQLAIISDAVKRLRKKLAKD